jgi:predicted enzyme related to lactoylglutathione lyase
LEELMNRPETAWGEVTVDCRDPERVASFWGQLLDQRAMPQSDGRFRLGPTVRGGPLINFQPVPEEKVGKTRVHLDIWVDDLDAAISLVEQLGGRHTGERHRHAEGKWVVVADPEGTEFCLVALAAP